eukprot:1106598-Rhodomonas_salina.1
MARGAASSASSHLPGLLTDVRWNGRYLQVPVFSLAQPASPQRVPFINQHGSSSWQHTHSILNFLNNHSNPTMHGPRFLGFKQVCTQYDGNLPPDGGALFLGSDDTLWEHLCVRSLECVPKRIKEAWHAQLGNWRDVFKWYACPTRRVAMRPPTPRGRGLQGAKT